MKILNTSCYAHRNKNKIKEDILDIGRALRIFEDETYLDTSDDGILYTWKKAYSEDICVNVDIDRIAQALGVIKEKHSPEWRETENEDTGHKLLL